MAGGSRKSGVFDKGRRKTGGRKKGTPNRRTVEKRLKDLREKNAADLASVFNSDSFRKRWKKALNSLIDLAADGDVKAIQTIRDLRNDAIAGNLELVFLDRMDVFSELYSIPAADITLEYFIDWTIKNAPEFCFSMESIKAFEDRARVYFDFIVQRDYGEREIEKINLIKQNTITSQQMHAVFSSLVEAMSDILQFGGSDRITVVSDLRTAFLTRVSKALPHYAAAISNAIADDEGEGA